MWVFRLIYFSFCVGVFAYMYVCRVLTEVKEEHLELQMVITHLVDAES